MQDILDEHSSVTQSPNFAQHTANLLHVDTHAHRILREDTEGPAEAGDDRPPRPPPSMLSRLGTMAQLMPNRLDPNEKACWCMTPTHCLRRASIAVVKSRCVCLCVCVYVCVCVPWLQRVVNSCVMGLCVLLDSVWCVRSCASICRGDSDVSPSVTRIFIPLCLGHTE